MYGLQLYDHRGERPEDFTHLELVNLVRRPGYDSILVALRMKLIDFVRSHMIFRGCYKDN